MSIANRATVQGSRLLKAAFASPLATALSLVSGLIISAIAWNAALWLIIKAVWPWQSADLCTQAAGICWPFLVEKARFILFGTFPYELHARPAAVSVLLCLLTILTCRQMTGQKPRLSVRRLMIAWGVGICLSFVLMGGGILGLEAVDPVRWNGLPILLMLSIIAVALAFPLGILLALARVQETYGFLSRLASVYIEVARGVPMLTVLFVGIFVLPLTLPEGTSISPVTATLTALVFFHAAYFAEDVRSGLLSLPSGQREAAQSLGLPYWQATRLVVLPQAIHRALPSLLNSIIGAYKDTSLVVVVGILDLTATARMSFGDPEWRTHAVEAYAFVGVWFFLSCAFLSGVGRELHRRSSR
ncbi:amino acid ABC transporter permease [Labrenzia sp. CE80]|uniref:amino acid ABC transporter permease n=1 Tax=Labrenzia sp. CE80 TaxID=1788986 RepID=UPI0013894304|nr:amino acid ABC transporter permease [Labrenzia sp. CE80]